MKTKRYVQYGCGLTAPEHWENFDASPTLRIQRTPVIGMLLKKKLNCNFPNNVKFGDIVKGLPVGDNFCDGIYCSHVLEHLSLLDFRRALQNTYRILKPGGTFRCVVPDLEVAAREYLQGVDKENPSASTTFLRHTLLGKEGRSKNVLQLLSEWFGNSNHLWMWDYCSLAAELHTVGFVEIRKCSFNDSSDKMFDLVESESRFAHAVAIECRK